jgi:hypothetical protein
VGALARFIVRSATTKSKTEATGGLGGSGTDDAIDSEDSPIMS